MANHFLDANGLNYYNQQKQDKLPINTSGSSSRVWVATNNKYNGGTGVLLGTTLHRFTTEQQITFRDLKGILDLLKDKDLTDPANISTNDIDELSLEYFIPTADAHYGILWKVAEILRMEDRQYAKYLRITYSTSKVSIYDQISINFYWTYPYYFKRMSAGSVTNGSTNATANGPLVGIVTANNYFTKWKAKEINSNFVPDATVPNKTDVTNEAYYKEYILASFTNAILETIYNSEGSTRNLTDVTEYTNYFIKGNGFYFPIDNAYDNEEPFGETLACRDNLGRVIVETSEYPFHAVNNKQFKEAVDNINSKLNNVVRKDIIDISNITNENASETVTYSGWYTIATHEQSSAGKLSYTGSSNFTVYVSSQGGKHTALTFDVNSIFNSASDTSIHIKTWEDRNANICNAVRVVNVNDDKTSTKVLLQIRMTFAPYTVKDPADPSNYLKYAGTNNLYVDTEVFDNGLTPWKLVSTLEEDTKEYTTQVIRESSNAILDTMVCKGESSLPSTRNNNTIYYVI